MAEKYRIIKKYTRDTIHEVFSSRRGVVERYFIERGVEATDVNNGSKTIAWFDEYPINFESSKAAKDFHKLQLEERKLLNTSFEVIEEFEM